MLRGMNKVLDERHSGSERLEQSMTASSRQTLELWLQRALLPGIVGAYLLAALWPAGGIWLRGFAPLGETASGLGAVTPLNVLLAILLFNTGLAVPFPDLCRLARDYRLILLALSIRLTTCGLVLLVTGLIGMLFVGPLSQEFLLGLVLVTIMPVANSSAGWSHHSEANIGLSMWLILLSVLLSPWLVPGLLVLGGEAMPDAAAEPYFLLARGYAGAFVLMWVVIPALLGMACRSVWSARYTPSSQTLSRGVTFASLVLLNYANGSVSLPEVLRGGRIDLAGLALLGALGLCGLLFVAAGLVGKLCRLPMPERLAVMYSSAMSNTGVALVLSTTLLPEAKLLHLVIIGYTLLQHWGAGLVDRWDYRTRRAPLRARASNSSMMTSQPVSNNLPERPTTQTGSQAAMMEPAASISNGS